MLDYRITAQKSAENAIARDPSKSIINERISKIVLREWQDDAYVGFNSCKDRIFVATVCPGAGKTMFGCYIAASSITEKGLWYVIILVPSLPIKKDWVKTATELGMVASGEYDNFNSDVYVRVATYSSAISTLNNIPAGSSVILITDEYHHAERKKEWGDNLELVAKAAKKIIALSGTPWRTTGKIALLESRYDKKGLIMANFSYDYAEDLRSDTRGTLPAHFILIDSVSSKDGQIVSTYDPPDTDADWDAITEIKSPDRYMGKHVKCSKGVENNRTAVKVLANVVTKLEEARKKHCPHAMALVVACNIDDADRIGAYLQKVYGLRIAVIHSKDTEISSIKGTEQIERIKKELSKKNPQVPDVIVSVGMVSEGVDIPALSVVGYLSAVVTRLYLYQVFFRVLRRIKRYFSDQGLPLAEPTYYDLKLSNSKVGYIVAPAHPEIVFVAKEIRKIVAQALSDAESSQATEPTGMRQMLTSDEYVQDSEGIFAQAINGNTLEVTLTDIINKLSLCPYITDVFGNLDAFEAWWQFMLDRDKPELIRLLNKHKNACLDQYNAVEKANIEPQNIPLSYDEEQQFWKSQHQQIVHIIRNSNFLSPRGIPYCEIADYGDAAKIIRGRINRRCGFTMDKNTTIENRKKWYEEAVKFHQELIDGHNR